VTRQDTRIKDFMRWRKNRRVAEINLGINSPAPMNQCSPVST
jgi:hypothetical protein